MHVHNFIKVLKKNKKSNEKNKNNRKKQLFEIITRIIRQLKCANGRNSEDTLRCQLEASSHGDGARCRTFCQMTQLHVPHSATACVILNTHKHSCTSMHSLSLLSFTRTCNLLSMIQYVTNVLTPVEARPQIKTTSIRLQLTCESSICDVKHETSLDAVLVISVALIHIVPRVFLSIQLVLRGVFRFEIIRNGCRNYIV